MNESSRQKRWLKKGTVYRGDSYISEDVVQVRFGALFDDGFITKRKENSISSNNKVWPLNTNCVLADVEKKKLTVVKSSHTLLSLAYGSYNSRILYAFKLSWPTSRMLAKDSLLLGFENVEDAGSWHQAFKSAISALSDPHTVDASNGKEKSKEKKLKRELKARGVGSSAGDEDTASDLQNEWASVEVLEEGTDESRGALLQADSLWPDEMESACSDVEESNSIPAGQQRTFERTASDSNILQRQSSIDEDSPGAYLKSWAPYRVLNGLAVYKEEDGEDGDGGAFMVSGTMKSSPKTCFEALMDTSVGRSNIWALTHIERIEHIDKHSSIFRARMIPEGAIRKFVSPRDVVLNRVWRYDDDGTYNVLFQSIEHPNFPPVPGFVRAHIDAMGFTIAPLKVVKSEGRDSSSTCRYPTTDEVDTTSGECLVTVVLKIDLAGCFTRNGLLRRCLMFVDSWERWWVESILMTVVALRDKVEQDRFVVRPFSIRMGPMLQPGKRGTSSSIEPIGRSGLTTYRQEPTKTASNHGGMRASVPLASSVAESWHRTPTQSAPGAASPASTDGILKPTLDEKYWSCPGTAGFKVRGPNYLRDRKKVGSQEPVFSLQGVELVKMPLKETVYHVARYLPIVRHSTAPFNFVLCLTLPYSGHTLGLVIVFSADSIPGPIASDESADENETENDHLPPFDLNMARFLAGSDSLRDMKLKLIPSLAEGSWVVRQAVGQTPVMLGKRLKSVYYQENGYLEVDIDIGANSTAAHITSLVAGTIKSLVFDIGIVIEGQQTDELPERLLGSVRLNHLDLTAAFELDTSVELEAVPRSHPTGMHGHGQSMRITRSNHADSPEPS